MGTAAVLAGFKEASHCGIAQAAPPPAPAVEKPMPVVRGIEYHGIYLGEPLKQINLAQTHCFYEANDTLRALLKQRLPEACLLFTADGRAVTRFVVWESGTYKAHIASLVARFGPPARGTLSHDGLGGDGGMDVMASP
jgi:hypothetical protein